MEMDLEKRKEKIERLLESRDLLFKSMIKYGTFNKCYNYLFAKIDRHLEEEGFYLDSESDII
jgi:hypothetical protein